MIVTEFHRDSLTQRLYEQLGTRQGVQSLFLLSFKFTVCQKELGVLRYELKLQSLCVAWLTFCV